MNRYVNPSALNILGGEQEFTPPAAEDQPNLAPKRTWKDKLKSGVKKVFGFLKRALDYTKNVVVPIVVAASGFLNAWSNLHRRTVGGRYVEWPT